MNSSSKHFKYGSFVTTKCEKQRKHHIFCNVGGWKKTYFRPFKKCIVFRETVAAWEKSQDDLKSKLESSKEKEKSLEDQLSKMYVERKTLEGKLAENKEKLEMAESSLASRGKKPLLIHRFYA